MTSQVEFRVDFWTGDSVCTSLATDASESNTCNVDTRRFTVYEDQIVKAMEDLTQLLAEIQETRSSSVVSCQL